MRDKNFGHVQNFCKPFATSLQMMRVEVAVYFDKNYIAHYIHIKCSNVLNIHVKHKHIKCKRNVM